MRRFRIIILPFLLLAASGVSAKAIRVGPDPCPVPAAAEPYVPEDGVNAGDYFRAGDLGWLIVPLSEGARWGQRSGPWLEVDPLAFMDWAPEPTACAAAAPQ